MNAFRLLTAATAAPRSGPAAVSGLDRADDHRPVPGHRHRDPRRLGPVQPFRPGARLAASARWRCSTAWSASPSGISDFDHPRLRRVRHRVRPAPAPSTACCCARARSALQLIGLRVPPHAASGGCCRACWSSPSPRRALHFHWDPGGRRPGCLGGGRRRRAVLRPAGAAGDAVVLDRREPGGGQYADLRRGRGGAVSR